MPTGKVTADIMSGPPIRNAGGSGISLGKFWRLGPTFKKRMKYVLTFFIFAILLIPIYLYYIDVISTINNTHFKIQINSLSKSSQKDNRFVNGFNITNIGALKMMDFRHSDCLETNYQIESDDFNSTRSLFTYKNFQKVAPKSEHHIESFCDQLNMILV